uniref:Uncharacterized protein n=1 Tax=Aegilops tauschii subsp. strangulata TaxID=200361 RepID=A0A452YAT0_AEGTS
QSEESLELVSCPDSLWWSSSNFPSFGRRQGIPSTIVPL